MTKSVECIGHRGAAGHAPENTVRGIECAIALGVDRVEFDVQLVGGEVVVFHDETLDRTTDGRGRLAECSLDYVRSLDAGDGQQVPLLSEILAVACGRAAVNIELKGAGCADRVATIIERAVAEDGWSFDDILVSSFDHRELLRLARRAPHILRAPLLYGIPRDLAACGTELGAYSINVSLDFAPEELIADAHRRGLRVYVYTVNTPSDLLRVMGWGVDGIFTDYPDRFHRARGAQRPLA